MPTLRAKKFGDGDEWAVYDTSVEPMDGNNGGMWAYGFESEQEAIAWIAEKRFDEEWNAALGFVIDRAVDDQGEAILQQIITEEQATRH